MVPDLRVILAVACIAALFEQTVAQKLCGSDVSGRLNTEVVLEKSRTIEVGQTEAVVNIERHAYGCDTVGVIAVACDPFEEPEVAVIDMNHVLVRRTYAMSTANLAVVTFCEYVISNNLPTSRMQSNSPVLPQLTVSSIPSLKRYY